MIPFSAKDVALAEELGSRRFSQDEILRLSEMIAFMDTNPTLPDTRAGRALGRLKEITDIIDGVEE